MEISICERANRVSGVKATSNKHAHMMDSGSRNLIIKNWIKIACAERLRWIPSNGNLFDVCKLSYFYGSIFLRVTCHGLKRWVFDAYFFLFLWSCGGREMLLTFLIWGQHGTESRDMCRRIWIYKVQKYQSKFCIIRNFTSYDDCDKISLK